MDEKKTIFIDGLTTATKSLVSRFREDNPRSSYLELVQHSSVEGKTYRARANFATPKKQETAKSYSPKPPSNPLLKRSKPALYAELSDESDDLFRRGNRADHADHLHLFGESPAYQVVPYSDDTSELPTTVPSQQDNEAGTDPSLYMTPRSRPPTPGAKTLRPQRMNFNDHASRRRPGWEAPRDHPRPSSPGPVARIICHVCYVKNDHIAPDCNLPLKDQLQVVRNYTALTAEEKSRVPATCFNRARTQFADDGSVTLERPSTSKGGVNTGRRPSDERHPAVLQLAKSPTGSIN